MIKHWALWNDLQNQSKIFCIYIDRETEREREWERNYECKNVCWKCMQMIARKSQRNCMRLAMNEIYKWIYVLTLCPDREERKITIIK